MDALTSKARRANGNCNLSARAMRARSHQARGLRSASVPGSGSGRAGYLSADCGMLGQINPLQTFRVKIFGEIAFCFRLWRIRIDWLRAQLRSNSAKECDGMLIVAAQLRGRSVRSQCELGTLSAPLRSHWFSAGQFL